MTVIGLSAGGVLSGWQAQQRDLAQALLISPAFDVPEVPDPLFAPAVRLASVLPSLFIPVDSAEDLPEYAYRHDGTRPVSAILLMGSAVRAAAMDHAPATSSITVVTNANDETIARKVRDLEGA